VRILFLWAMGAGAVFAAAPFSHRVHLKMQLQCVTCHAAAPSSTRLEDNLLPDRKVCLDCHKEAEVPSQPPATRLAGFNHSLHLQMGNVGPVLAAAIDAKRYLSPSGDLRRHLNGSNACEACHRGLAESDRVSHSDLPKMADCLVCHNQIEVPYSCEKCHAKGAELKPGNHSPAFLDTHTSGKLGLDKTTCAVCHGRKFTCLGCH
jgi:hypothetical protein